VLHAEGLLHQQPRHHLIVSTTSTRHCAMGRVGVMPEKLVQIDHRDQAAADVGDPSTQDLTPGSAATLGSFRTSLISPMADTSRSPPT
jgi:hypothetical protein